MITLAEVCDDSAAFTITLTIPVIDIRVEIIDFPPNLEEGEDIHIIARVHNDTDKKIELREAEILEGTTSIWKVRPLPSPNIEANSHRDFELWTFLRAPKMLNRSVTLKAKMCVDYTAW